MRITNTLMWISKNIYPYIQWICFFGFILAIILLTTAHFIIGNILETKWLGQGMDLNPVIVVACLIFWALVWGVMGALLAVPLTSIAKMIFEQYESTRPLASILAGRNIKKTAPLILSK